LPVVSLIKLLDNCPPPVLQAINKLRSRNTILVYLLLKKATFKYQYITVFDHSLEAGRITNFNAWQESDTEKDTVLCIEYWCSTNDINWNLTKEEMTSKAVNELHRAAIIDKNDLLDSEVLRVPNSHPVLNRGYGEALTTINNYLATYTNLAVAGRHATFTWDGQADNIIAGMKLAEKIKAMNA
jgi:protoporphyrinogen oxidase